eukprot:scaffold64_cov338-Pavlova_lutheri.AAC.95
MSRNPRSRRRSCRASQLLPLACDPFGTLPGPLPSRPCDGRCGGGKHVQHARDGQDRLRARASRLWLHGLVPAIPWTVHPGGKSRKSRPDRPGFVNGRHRGREGNPKGEGSVEKGKRTQRSRCAQGRRGGAGSVPATGGAMEIQATPGVLDRTPCRTKTMEA